MRTLKQTVYVLTISFLLLITSTATSTTRFDVNFSGATNYLVGKWKNTIEEREEYSNGRMIEKKITNFTGSKTGVVYKPDGLYASTYYGEDVGGGTWRLSSASHLILDKYRRDERHFQIILIDTHNLVTRGPFTASGEVKGDFLYTFHYKK